MANPVFSELLSYVGFGESDAALLRQLHPEARSHFPRIANVFYMRIVAHPDARRALEGGEAVVGRLKKLLVEWMDSTLLGPWDDAYFERRARIGRAHVRIGLAQHYMFGGMNVLRRELGEVADALAGDDAGRRLATRASLDRILDVELGIMLFIYRESQEALRLQAVQTLTAGLSHEIRNPLNAAGLQLAVLERRLHRLATSEQAGALQPLRLVQDEIHRLDHLLEDFLQFARPVELVGERVELGPLVQSVTTLVAKDAEERGVRMSVHLEADLVTRGVASRLREVILNLVLNALEATPSGGEVRLSACRTNAQVEFRVEDSGHGVPPELRERIFQPFFTTKSHGSGLGLAIVQTIIGKHGGALRLDETDLGGASFRVQLPVG